MKEKRNSQKKNPPSSHLFMPSPVPSSLLIYLFFGCSLLHKGFKLLNQGSNPLPLHWECRIQNHWSAREVPVLISLLISAHLNFNKQPYEVDSFISILQMRRLKHTDLSKVTDLWKAQIPNFTE